MMMIFKQFVIFTINSTLTVLFCFFVFFQVLFLFCMFGYLVILIFYKWIAFDVNSLNVSTYIQSEKPHLALEVLVQTDNWKPFLNYTKIAVFFMTVC